MAIKIKIEAWSIEITLMIWSGSKCREELVGGKGNIYNLHFLPNWVFSCFANFEIFSLQGIGEAILYPLARWREWSYKQEIKCSLYSACLFVCLFVCLLVEWIMNQFQVFWKAEGEVGWWLWPILRRRAFHNQRGRSKGCLRRGGQGGPFEKREREGHVWPILRIVFLLCFLLCIKLHGGARCARC